MKYINVPLFIVSLTIGLFVTYISNSPKTTIIVYPTVDNDDKILYKDKADNCYSFRHEGMDYMAGGGIAGIRRPWAIPPESGPDPYGGGLSSQFNRVKKLTG